MYRDEQITYGVIALSAVLVYFVIIPWQISEPSWVSMSPAFLPRICAVLIFVLAIYKLLSTLPFGNGEFLIGRGQYLRVFGVLGILTASTIGMFYVGFWAALGLSLIPLQLMAGQRNWLTILLYAAALVAASFCLLRLANLYLPAPY